ncbi:ribokinase [Amycolatopsis cihanbeyliensis]
MDASHGRPEVLVVGSANADLVVAAERRPAGGETVLGGDTEILPGGKGANTAVAAARLGARVGLLAAVGEDGNGRVLLDSLRESGVYTDLVHLVDRPTGAAYITVTPDGENSILVSPGANNTLRPADVDTALPGAGIMVASMEIPLPTVEHAVLAAAEAGIRPILNLSPVAKVSERVLRVLDVLLVNEHEGAWLLASGFGKADADPRRLLELGPRAAVVTRGARGALVLEDDGVTGVDSPEVEAVDTTGAGDAFAGALAATLVAGASLADAARRAVRVAAVSVTRHGAQPSYPYADELPGGGQYPADGDRDPHTEGDMV